MTTNQLPFAVKFYGSARTTTSNFETFESMDEAVQDYQSKGGRCDAYQWLENGKTIDPYTGEGILAKNEAAISKMKVTFLVYESRICVYDFENKVAYTKFGSFSMDESQAICYRYVDQIGEGNFSEKIAKELAICKSICKDLTTKGYDVTVFFRSSQDSNWFEKEESDVIIKKYSDSERVYFYRIDQRYK